LLFRNLFGIFLNTKIELFATIVYYLRSSIGIVLFRRFFQETSLLGWSEIEICKKQQKLQSKKLRTLIMNNFYSLTFQNFECGWPRLGLKDRNKKIKYFETFFEKFRISQIYFILTLPNSTYLSRKMRSGHLSIECLFLRNLFFSQKSSFLIKCPGPNSH
jgi:hypothetical protein